MRPGATGGAGNAVGPDACLHPLPENPLEPAKYGCKILHGPHVWNFGEIYQLLKEYNVSSKVNNVDQLIKQTNKDFNKKGNSLKIKTKIKNIGDKILNSTFNEIKSFIK